MKIADEKYYWSPVMYWKMMDHSIYIGMKKYEERKYLELFPEFYFFTQNGVSYKAIVDKFRSLVGESIESIIKIFINDRVLVSTILDPEELFSSQTKLLEHEYGSSLIIDPYASELFKIKQQMRECALEEDLKIKLPEVDNFPQPFENRTSVRKFKTTEKIGYEAFGRALSIFGHRKRDNRQISYYYASAGGLYPIDIYVYIKPERVEKIPGGLYYYNPVKNSLMCLDQYSTVPADAHYFSNRSIYMESACSIYFVYDPQVSMPKYGGSAYQYALIDTGIMIATMNFVCEDSGLGMCSIGAINSRKINKLLKLPPQCKMFHSVEVGLKI